MLGNPVDKAGRIQPRTEAWKGVPTFIVTSTFSEHVASGRGPGIDIGNSQIGYPVYAMAAGTVSLAGLLGAAKVVRIRHATLDTKFGGAVVSGYAHLNAIMVTVGQTVAKGQQIGTVGMTGATAPHLHGGFTVNGVERDFWPYLDQNIQGAEVSYQVNEAPFIGANGQPANATVTFIGGKTVTGWALNGTSEKYLVPAGGSTAPASGRAAIYQSDNRAPHGGMGADGNVTGRPFIRVPLGVFSDHPYIAEAAHVAAGAISVSPPPPPTSGGFTQADLDKANKDGFNEGRGKVQAAAAGVPPKT